MPPKVLTAATVKGTVAPGVWDVKGAVGTVTLSGAVGLAGQPWELTSATTLGSLTLGKVADAVVTATGSAGAVKAIEWLDGSFSAVKVASITTTGAAAVGTAPGLSGDFGADVTLAYTGAACALGTLSVAGWLTGATVSSAGAVGTVKVGGMCDSCLEAHDAGTQKSIGSFTVQGLAGQTDGFINSNVSGGALGTVVLRGVRTNNMVNAGADFGVTGRKIASYTRWQGKAAARKASNLVGAKVVEQVEDYVLQLI